MAVTQNTYTGNGSTVLYSFTFPYLSTADIKVSINGTLTTAYTLANATTVQFNTAPVNGAAIRIYRDTPGDTPDATFYSGSAIRSQDLNDNFTQVLYYSQETRAFAESTDASAVQATANTALANSNTAISTANAASATANGIAGTANTALANSNTAVTTANAALPKTGGTMTGAITFVGNQTFPGTAELNVTQTFTAGQRAEITVLTDGATITPDLADSNNFSVTLAGNRTLANPTNIVAGQSGSIFISQDGTGSRTLAYGSYWDFAGGSAPTLSTAINAVDRLDYIVRTSTSIHAVLTKALS
jgi:hypothetical protein